MRTYHLDDAGRVLATDPTNSQRVAVEADISRRIVRRVIDRDGHICEAFMHRAMGNQHEWTPPELEALQTKLVRCDLTVAEWLISAGNER